ncbi:MAG: hypothetical protein WCW25_04790 [Patescibacteria group bacterium]|jgi:hypothetical protein
MNNKEYLQEDIYPPPETLIDVEKDKGRRKVLRVLDEKISEIDQFLENGAVGKVAKFEECSVLTDNLHAIRATLKKLVPLIDNFEHDIIGGCFLEDRLGGLEMSLALIKRLAEGKSRAKYYIENCEKMSTDFRKYFNNCLRNEELLRLALETEKGPENYIN